jgi:hypothetical protein
MTPTIEFNISGSNLSMSFCVVETLINEIILGRDFMIMYDVMVDVPGQRLLLRNTTQKFATKVEQTLRGSKIRCVITVPKDVVAEQTSGYVKCAIRPVASMLTTWQKWMRHQRGKVPVWVEGNVAVSPLAQPQDISMFECVTSMDQDEIMIPLSLSETWAMDIEDKSARDRSVKLNLFALRAVASRVDLEGNPLSYEDYLLVRDVAGVNGLVDQALLDWDAWSSM